MADVKQLIQEALQTVRVMHLATSVNNQPWVCNVHFYADEEMNLYWISTPARRHSQEIEQNSKVCATLKVHEDTPSEQYVIGLSVEGVATMISDDEAQKIANQYISKLNKAATLFQDMLQGRNPHKFYRLKPTNFTLFDTKNFPDNPRQELAL